jgi:hypothetical protein
MVLGTNTDLFHTQLTSLVCITETEYVFTAVRDESLNII